MKKLISIMLVLCMMVTVVPMAFATENEVVIDAMEDVVSWYDNGMNGGNGSYEKYNENLMLRQCGEWVTYDISDLNVGTYSVSVTYKSTAQVAWKTIGLEFVVDGDLELRSYLDPTGKNWDEEPGTMVAGKIYVHEGAEELKVENHGMYPINLDIITLTYIGVEDTSEDIRLYGQNATSSPDEAKTGAKYYLGVDYWDVATGTESPYTQEDSEGKLHLPYTHSNILATGMVIHHPGDWTRYDVSSFKSGTYELTIRRAHMADTTYSIKIDGKEALSSKITKTGTDYSNYEEVVLGKIYITEDAQYLVMGNLGSGSVYLDYMNFAYVSDEDVTEVANIEFKYNTNTNTTSEATDAEDYTSGWYYDSAGNQGFQISGGVVIRQNDWVKYDLATLKNGFYNLTVNCGSSGAATITFKTINKLGNVIGTYTHAVPNTAYKATDYVINNINITNDMAYIIVENKTSPAIIMNKFTFTGTFDSNVAFTQDEAGENAIETIGSNTKVYAHVNLANSTPSKDVTVVVAVYNKDGLVTATPEKNIRAAKSTEVSRTYEIPVKAGEFVKVFVWDNFDSMVPFEGAAVIS